MSDPLFSLFLSVLIFRYGWALTREYADVLLESVPAGFHVKRVETELVGHVPGLLEIHHVHVWSLTGQRPMVTVHANLAPETERRKALIDIHARLRERLNIVHVTVQIEAGRTCETPPCAPH